MTVGDLTCSSPTCPHGTTVSTGDRVDHPGLHARKGLPERRGLVLCGVVEVRLGDETTRLGLAEADRGPDAERPLDVPHEIGGTAPIRQSSPIAVTSGLWS